MANYQTKEDKISASASDTVMVISPDTRLVKDIKTLCDFQGLRMFVGDPNSPDLIAVPYRIGILDKEFIDPQVWSDFVGFEIETSDIAHEHLLVIIQPGPGSEAELNEAKREFDGVSGPIKWVFKADCSQVVPIVANWLDH